MLANIPAPRSIWYIGICFGDFAAPHIGVLDRVYRKYVLNTWDPDVQSNAIPKHIKDTIFEDRKRKKHTPNIPKKVCGQISIWKVDFSSYVGPSLG